MKTRTAGTARMLHLILEVLLCFRAEFGETADAGESGNKLCGGRGEGGGVNI